MIQTTTQLKTGTLTWSLTGSKRMADITSFPKHTLEEKAKFTPRIRSKQMNIPPEDDIII